MEFILLCSIHLLVSIVVLFIIYRIIRYLVRLISSTMTGTETSGTTLFVSFGITALLFTDTLQTTFRSLGWFFISPVRDLANLVNHGRETTDTTILSQLTENWAYSLTNNFSRDILGLPLGKLFFMFSFWILLTLLFKIILSEATDDTSGSKAMEGFFKKKTTKNILVTIFMVFSIYLCVSAIIAYAEFKNIHATENVAVVAEDLEKELEKQAALNQSTMKISFTDSIFAQAVKVKIDTYTNVVVKQLTDDVKQLSDDFNSTLDKSLNSDDKLKNIAINMFTTALGESIGAKEKAIYKGRLIQWYIDEQTKWINIAWETSNAIKSSEKRVVQFLSSLDYRTEYNIDSTAMRLNPDGINELNSVYNSITDARTRLYDLKYYDFNPTQAPNKPEIGERFGVFRKISGWLLTTESMTLAIVVGLFGFGLLGAIGSSYIRRLIMPLSDTASPQLVDDIGSILVNGISATIVVFLAVKGAIATFAEDTEELNAYALFFACLLAAVFSDDVWRWAKEKLKEKMK